MQTAFLDNQSAKKQINLPPENEEVMPGVKWGPVNGFGSPAFWKYMVSVRRMENRKINYKLGRSLLEETTACILGGHGIPATMGLAAYNHIKSCGAFEKENPTESQFYNWLTQPINHKGKLSKYRFARQKAKYLSDAFQMLDKTDTSPFSPVELRNWLLNIKGVGYKTASWIVRNWKESDDVAILDIHILRAGQLARFFEPEYKVEKHYLELEKKIIAFSNAIDIGLSELDAVIWYEMMAAPSVVNYSLKSMKNFDRKIY